MAFNIRSKQTDALMRMLNLNVSNSGGKDLGDVYKVLILDKFCKDILAPLLRVNDLRKQGVTLHLALEADRQAIPDVPAVYFVQPTPANIDRLVQDATAGLYDSMHINFVSSAPGRYIEQLAAGAVKSNALSRMSKVFDQYLSFVALEPSLFSLNLPNCYLDLNDPSAKDSQIEAAVNSIVDGLFSALVTLAAVPIIRCPSGGAAEHVASLLDSKLRDALKSRNNLFSEGAPALSASLSRPILCIFDRNFDLAAMLQHNWSYKPMVHDVLAMRLNKVTLGPEPAAAAAGPQPPGPGGQKRSYDVDDKDFFWETCGAYEFPKVAEEVEQQIQKYQAIVEDIGRKAAAGGDGMVDEEELLRQSTQHLMSAVSSLPELQEKKKTLDKHANLAHALLGAIKARNLDQFYNLEEDMLTGKGDVKGVMKLVQHAKGTATDKLRLAIVHLLSCDALPTESEYSELESELKLLGADTTALAYIRKLRKNNLVGPVKGKGADAGTLAGLGLASQNNLLDWADKTFGSGINVVTKSVKNLLSGARQAPVTAAVEALMDGKQGSPDFDSFAVFDPKMAPGRATVERAKGPFREAVVFVIGGGNYLERETIQAWATRAQPAKQIVYGCSDMLTGNEFLDQLQELGRRSGASM